MTPAPTEPVPILIGGHGEAALRRAARSGDGWMHGGGDPGELPGLLDRLGRAAGRSTAGTTHPFEVHVISMDAYTVDGVRRLEEIGVTDVIVGFRWPYVVGPDTEPLQDKIDALERYADDVIAKVTVLSRARRPWTHAEPPWAWAGEVNQAQASARLTSCADVAPAVRSRIASNRASRVS